MHTFTTCHTSFEGRIVRGERGTGSTEQKRSNSSRLKKVMEVLSVTLVFWAVSVCEAFNIDEHHALTYRFSPLHFFGFSVQQFQTNQQQWILVGAPLQHNLTEKLYLCTTDLQNCTALKHTGLDGIKSLSLSVSSTKKRVTSCTPYVTRECDGNSFLSGFCSQLDRNFQLVSNFSVASQKCTKRKVNLVFLFDGSSSMSVEFFDLNKYFISDVMKNFTNTSIKFAAVQFSSHVNTVFDFNDYQTGLAEDKLMREKQMRQLTFTYRAINYALTNLFNNVSSGAHPNATKVLVIITDGDPLDKHNKTEVLSDCENQKIQRYIIGVGKVKLENLHQMASEPRESNTFYINNYTGLHGLLDRIQNKIYNIEGSKEDGRDRQNELSQSGFSVVHHRDSMIVGSVGSYDWSGALYEVSGSGSELREKEMKDSEISKDSYLGYSVVLGRRGNISLLASGAPRAEHKGQVTLFSLNGGEWMVEKRFAGEQIGSYFGASVCLLDVDSDGESDFLLVGAPFFHQRQPKLEGRMYIYHLSERFVLKQNVSRLNTGRFAASLAALKDLNGDGLSDVAVGAPLTDDGQGVVFIYLGDRTHGINLDLSPQMVKGSSVLPGLQQFGVSISGQMDMNGDNLTDVVVGARGGVTLLKALPVMSVSSQLNFNPKEISLNIFECAGGDAIHGFNLMTCFTLLERTSSTGSFNKTLNLTLGLELDVGRIMSRGFFERSNTSSRSFEQSVLLDSRVSCFSFPVFMPQCVSDTKSPVKVQMKFSQSKNLSENSVALLDVQSHTDEQVEMTCNDSCIDDLRVNLSFKTDTLLVVNQAQFTALIHLVNYGSDSVNTRVVLQYPDGLSFSKFEPIQPSRIRSRCVGDDDARNRTTCRINWPLYRSGILTVFQATFRVMERDYDWSDMMEMVIGANSDNSANTSHLLVRKSVPVQFAVDLAISLVPEDSSTFLNFSLEDKSSKTLYLIYKIENLDIKDLPVSVSLNLPCPTADVMLQDQTFRAQENLTQCHFIQGKQDDCGRFECSYFSLRNFSAVFFQLSAQATLRDNQHRPSKYRFQEVRWNSLLDFEAHLNFNRTRYRQTMTGLKNDPHRSQATLRIVLFVTPCLPLIVCTGAGCGFILLIIILVMLVKCGFFKRKRPEDFPTLEPEASTLTVESEEKNKQVDDESGTLCNAEE